MLTVEEIKQFIDEDAASEKKRFARKGEAYYSGEHDILGFRLFYFDAHGQIKEDKTRSNIKIPHPFFTELVDQATQYILSGENGFVRSDIPELQTELDAYFNENEDFTAELSEALTDSQTKGFSYMYACKDEEGKTVFKCADAIGVVEVEAKFASDHKDHVLYWYVERIDKDGKQVKRIIDFDAENKYFYLQTDEGIVPDKRFKGKNAKPHITYHIPGDPKTYYDNYGLIPFFRLDNNKKQHSSLKPIKPLIDDYDLMASSLSNNLVDFDTPIHLVKGFEGDNLDELQQNLKTKKIIGVGENGGMDVMTVDVPYQARQTKLELDEKNIYRFGFGLNLSGLKDTAATTNIAIKAAYSLLDLKCSKIQVKLKQFLRKMIKVVLDEINKEQNTDYQMKDVYFAFDHEIMSNEQENTQNKLIEAQARQAEITTLLNLAAHIDNELLMQLVAEQLELDWEEVKNKVKDLDEAENNISNAQGVLDAVPIEETA